ncbi:MAG: ricin-type beta-trefoil lectin domain protein [Streptosporangiaceae bacterium]|nr:ricin-type beta-trefoil lectin domain protein [Streptosporangiaceae bacterium]MBV9856529.1 ricin-type beta-trefoil lectin domain protein [Streptosporangiaceae bacterium]
MRLLPCRPLTLSAVSLLALLGLGAVPSAAGAAASPASGHGTGHGGGGASVAARSLATASIIPPAPPLPSGTKRACATPTRAGEDACQLLLRSTAVRAPGTRAAQPVSGAFGPSDLLSAYNLRAASAAVPAGTTVAIVDVYADPRLAPDLASYRQAYSLPACDSTTGAGCLTVLNQNGGSSLPTATDPSGTGGWEAEQALDVEMVSAICPSCKIVMLEASSNSTSDLGTAENSAVNVVGAKFVSNSWSGFDFPGESFYDALYFRHPGAATAFASGDIGYGAGYPASSQLVTSVGGTYLARDPSAARGWTETVWDNEPSDVIGGTGSGCSAGEGKPAWQADTGCPNRTENDVSAVASGPAGVSMYDSFGTSGNFFCGSSGDNWCSGYGTSVATPVITSVYALAGTPAPGTYPSSYPYQSGQAAHLYRVTNGSDGICEATRLYLCNAAGSLASGYNGPAGWGTPNGTAAFRNSVTANIVSVDNPGALDIQAGASYSAIARVTATDSASGQTLTYSATGLPAGLSISSSTGLISGKASAPGTSAVKVTVSDQVGARSTAAFTIAAAASLRSAYHPGSGAVRLNLGGKCMDDTGNSIRNGDKIQIWACNGGASQDWGYYPDTDPGDAGVLTVHGKCLDVVNGGTANGSKLQLWSCISGSPDQQWYIVGAAGELYNPRSGKCADDPYSSTANGRQLDIWTCNDGSQQAWTLPASPVLSGVSGTCMDDTANSGRNGNKIQVYSCDGLASQRWTTGLDGSLRINGKCLDATGNGTTDGTKIQLWTCVSGAANQEWAVGAFGMLENINAEKCLADPDNTPANGTQLVLEDCTGQQGQIWAES